MTESKSLRPSWHLRLCLFSSILCFVLGVLVPAQAAEIAVVEDVLADFRAFMNEGGDTAEQDTETFTVFERPSARRDVVEVGLVIKALRRGGYDEAINLVPMPSYARMIQQVEQGQVTLTGSSTWKNDFEAKEAVAASFPLIPNGKFLVGLYTRPNHPDVFPNMTADEIKTLHFVSSKSWRPDWSALTALAPKHLSNIRPWESMVRMVSSGRADVLLAPFQSGQGMELRAFGQTLVPLMGVRLSLNGERVIAISLANPAGAKAHKALDRGLMLLAEDGTIERAYNAAGVYPERTRTWHVINLPDNT
ncbi:hypothetical protein JM93_00306 [Roseibium hamelinense]|uniref:ABC-type amino acid transport substrate-binding protein n=1 Tax=Roseibium hamelinense TaxID=150831 RepID=A0A562TJ87_9HYPH|nr:hypothetical protein [Roseibium hamelinense]MTI46049.1 hypothetical protein [Roseibium hamelinense]TWI92760.1 hypothetical protein JM93_00306 [Roseibium hamelinense]